VLAAAGAPARTLGVYRRGGTSLVVLGGEMINMADRLEIDPHPCALNRVRAATSVAMSVVARPERNSF